MGLVFYVVLAVAIVLALFLVALLHAGFFTDLRIRTSTPLSCPKRVAYKFHTGSYKQCGGAFRRVMSLAPTLKTFGVYYDDPRKVQSTRYSTSLVGLTVVCSMPGPRGKPALHRWLLPQRQQLIR